MKAHGEQHYHSRLTPEKVRRIRAAHFPYVVGYSRLAREFGVSWEAGRDVCTYRTWRHVR